MIADKGLLVVVVMATVVVGVVVGEGAAVVAVVVVVTVVLGEVSEVTKTVGVGGSDGTTKEGENINTLTERSTRKK